MSDAYANLSALAAQSEFAYAPPPRPLRVQWGVDKRSRGIDRNPLSATWPFYYPSPVPLEGLEKPPPLQYDKK
ncbi:hypothetical protein JTE90_029135 [Oedothorax gibbosus]|uniref:Uncharacterized protein n=1 Tax=Oedothorax gibbosus TaxID=931172 RepID=A0AAV6UKG0_9ARAC|nr:hypothetical protein JTE90_029135 [Oedothorax gibbosus]